MNTLTKFFTNFDNSEISSNNIDENIELIGRTYVWKDTLWCPMSGSGIRFVTNATKITFTLLGDVAAKENNRLFLARAGIFVNNERVTNIIMDETSKTVSVSLISNNLNNVNQSNYVNTTKNTVEFLKLSECAFSTVGIREITFEYDGELIIEKINPKILNIEFVGDSITCGYGVDIENPLHPFSTDSEDCTKSFAYQAGRKLDANMSLVSFSGWGIISGYTEDDTPHRDQLVSAFYDKCGFSYSNPIVDDIYGPRPQDINWNFSNFVPDIVVINLGTNDGSFCKQIDERHEWFRKDYIEFLKDIRKHNPNAKIVGCIGLMATSTCETVKKAISDYIEQTKDTNVNFLQLPLQAPENGLACDYHPTYKSHAIASDVLVDFLLCKLK